jgi:tetratricopeptide (TPR) repeat protein
MYRRVVLAVFVLLVAVSAIYALMDKKKVTTSSDEAYRAYLSGEELSNKLYRKEALQEFEKAIRLDPKFAMAYAMAARLYYSFDRMDEYKQAKVKALSLLGNVKELERIQIQRRTATRMRRRSCIPNSRENSPTNSRLIYTCPIVTG